MATRNRVSTDHSDFKDSYAAHLKRMDDENLDDLIKRISSARQKSRRIIEISVKSKTVSGEQSPVITRSPVAKKTNITILN